MRQRHLRNVVFLHLMQYCYTRMAIQLGVYSLEEIDAERIISSDKHMYIGLEVSLIPMHDVINIPIYSTQKKAL